MQTLSNPLTFNGPCSLYRLRRHSDQNHEIMHVIRSDMTTPPWAWGLEEKGAVEAGKVESHAIRHPCQPSTAPSRAKRSQ